MTVYHYTSDRLRTKHPHEESLYKEGTVLKAMPSVDLGIPVVFALLDPIPNEWNSSRFRGLFDNLMFHTGRLLLEVDTNASYESVYVVDYAHLVGIYHNNGEVRDLDERYSHASLDEAREAYRASRIPLRDYIGMDRRSIFVLPEVIIEADVPAENVRVSSQQPLIESLLEAYAGVNSLYFRNNVRKLTSELGIQKWYNEYIQRNPALGERTVWERLFSFKERR